MSEACFCQGRREEPRSGPEKEAEHSVRLGSDLFQESDDLLVVGVGVLELGALIRILRSQLLLDLVRLGDIILEVLNPVTELQRDVRRRKRQRERNTSSHELRSS